MKSDDHKSREELIRELSELRSRLSIEKRRTDKILESVSDAFLVLDQEARITYVNAAGVRLSGIKREDLIGRCVWDLFPHATTSKFKSEYDRTVETKKPVHFEEFYPDPLNIWVESHGYYFPEGLAVFFRDISHRKQAEAARHESEQQLKRSQQIAHLGSWELDIAEGRLVWSDEVYRILGLPPEFAPTYEAFRERVHPKDRAAVDAAYSDSVRGKLQKYEIEHRIIQKSTGEIRFVHEKCEHFRDVDGRVIRSIGMIHDITERKRMELALQEANQRYALVVAGAEAAIWDWDVLRRKVTFSPRWKTMRGFAEHEIIDETMKDWKAGIHPEDAPRVMASLQAHLDGDSPIYNQEYRVQRKDGTWMWIEDRGLARRDSSGCLVQVAGSETDITARRQAEEALRKSEHRYRSLFQSLESFTLLEPVLDADGHIYDFRYIEVNDQGARLREMPAEAIRGRTVMELFPNIDPYWIQAYGQVATTEQPVQFERLNQRNGRWYRTYVYCPEKGKIASLIIDITDRKQTEQALQELTATLEQKVAERTELAEARAKQLQTLAVELIEAEERERRRIAELLHEDLQQMLVAVKMQLRAACDDQIEEPMLPDVERLLEESIQKTRQLSHELSPPVLYHTGLIASLDWLARQMQEQFGLQVELEANEERQFENQALKMFLFRAVQELLFNIIKHADVKKARVVLSGSDNSLVINVSDQGRGFDPGILDLTTKKLGLGLLSMRERVHYIGGHLLIESLPGQGARFTLAVPCGLSQDCTTDQVVPEAEHPVRTITKPADSAPATCIRMLFADDHEVMRKGLIRLVAGQPDVEVVGEAANGQEALELTRQLRPNLVVMDISMPIMDGIEATRRIKAEFPDVRVIGLSMHHDEQLALTMRQAGAEIFLEKTASSAGLLRAIYGIDCENK